MSRLSRASRQRSLGQRLVGQNLHLQGRGVYKYVRSALFVDKVGASYCVEIGPSPRQNRKIYLSRKKENLEIGLKITNE